MLGFPTLKNWYCWGHPSKQMGVSCNCNNNDNNSNNNNKTVNIFIGPNTIFNLYTVVFIFLFFKVNYL